jgi:hypothetical protein
MASLPEINSTEFTCGKLCPHLDAIGCEDYQALQHHLRPEWWWDMQRQF